jgi:hypothetical protein
MGNGGILPRILNLGTRWRWVVNFTSRFLYPRGKGPVTHWAPEQIWTLWQRDEISAPAGNRTPVVQSSTCSLYCLSYPGSVVLIMFHF